MKIVFDQNKVKIGYGGINTVQIRNGDRVYNITDDGGDGICVYVEPEQNSTLTFSDEKGVTYEGLTEIFIEEFTNDEDSCCSPCPCGGCGG